MDSLHRCTELHDLWNQKKKAGPPTVETELLEPKWLITDNSLGETFSSFLQEHKYFPDWLTLTALWASGIWGNAHLITDTLAHGPIYLRPFVHRQNVLRSVGGVILTGTWMRKQGHRANFPVFPEDGNYPKRGNICTEVESLDTALLCLCTALVMLQNLLLGQDHALILQFFISWISFNACLLSQYIFVNRRDILNSQDTSFLLLHIISNNKMN